jgi:hypothetical protein
MNRTWLNEFGPAYDVPQYVQALVKSGQLVDASWGNDICPSFTVPGTGAAVQLWTDHPEAEHREMGGARYTVTLSNVDSGDCDCLAEDPATRTVYSGNDIITAVVVALAVAKSARENFEHNRKNNQ